MQLPLTVGIVSFTSAAALGAAALRDAGAGGGVLVEGEGPEVWVLRLVSEGLLSQDEAVALAGHLVGSESPATAAGARLAEALGSPVLAQVLDLALGTLDLGVLHAVDPGVPGASVEDALLHAWGRLADLTDAPTRVRLLQRLRHAGLADAELVVLLHHGSPAEIEAWLPAILEEGPAPEPLLRAARERGPAVAAAVERALA